MQELIHHSRKIAALNDEVRRTLKGGRVETSAGVDKLDIYTQICAYQLVRDSKVFADDNDPYDERDFGGFVIGAHRFIWKIDYLDTDMVEKSADPSNPKITTRILKIMLADEYCLEPISPQSGL